MAAQAKKQAATRKGAKASKSSLTPRSGPNGERQMLHKNPTVTFAWQGKPMPYRWTSHGKLKEATLPSEPFTLADAKAAATKAGSGLPQRRAELILWRLLKEKKIKPVPEEVKMA